ncbi:hypothetical protein B0H13DRAFT_733583 [Mycena leptocephala]|nr:hypothetical protein B0H13DRAFT_733583 [Mycena leptocephala]
MDPVLATITLGTFVKDVVELVRNIKDSIYKVRENKERLSKLRDEVVDTLNGLTKLTEGHEDRQPSPELKIALEGLKSRLRHIGDKCQKQVSRQRTSRVPVVDGIKSWWNRNEIESEIKRLNECWSNCRAKFMLFSTARIELGTVKITRAVARIEDSTLQIAEATARIEMGTVQSVDTIARVEERTVQITGTTTRIEHITVRIELEQKLEKWLQYPPDMKKKQDDTQELHHEGTGNWFLDGPQFGEWKDKPGSLWIRGHSGAGKSVLSSIVIRKLFNDRAEGAAVAYFYFNFRDERGQGVKIMLRS